ncbi:MAG: Kelch repeat-containing protein [Acidimicrobiales bacterium]
MSARLAVALGLVMLAVACDSGNDAMAPGGGPESHSGAELPVPRTEVSGTLLAGMVVVVGGLTADGRASSLVHLYDPVAMRWRPGPSLPLGLHHFGLATLDDRVWLAGGYANDPGGSWKAQSGTFSLGVGEASWREEPPLTEPRGGLAVAALGGDLAAIGGTTATGVTARVEVLNPGQGGWRPGPDLLQARDHLAAASSGGRVYAIGGRLGPLESNLDSVESWAPGGMWRPEPPLNDSRGGTAAAEVAARVCVAGGEEPDGTIGSVECLVGGRWQRSATLRVPRHGLAVAGLGSQLHVVGGGPQPGLTVSGAHEVLELE